MKLVMGRLAQVVLALAAAYAYGQYVPFDPNGPLGPGVKGAPFSAEIVTESVQTLADGTHVRSGTHGRGLRDSAGRTREEIELPQMPGDNGEKFSQTMIIDPVQHVRISLNQVERTATIQHSDLGVRIVPDTPPGTSVRRRQPGEKDLGTMVIEGLTATGKSFTYITEVGRIGNDKPISNVNEEWFSSDLKIVVITKYESPYTGKSIWKLINISAAEPDPALFQVPSDYKVIQQ
jgi:hypothetical protein